MQLNKFVFLVVILGVDLSYVLGSAQEFTYAEVDLEGSCPKVKVITNLDLIKLCGWWYRAYNTITNQFCYNNQGQTVYAAPFNETALSFVACCQSAANSAIPVCGENIGTGFVSPGTNPGEFIYNYGSNEYILYSLDTDYVNFNLIYGCSLGTNSVRDETIFVLSRFYELTPTSLNRIREVLRWNGSSLSNARPIKQGPLIPYTPNTRQCNGGN